MSHFEFYETNADGEPKEKPQRIEYVHAKNVLALRFPGSLRQLLHFIDLAAAAPGHPVDVTWWQGEGENRSLAYSARLTYVTPAKPIIFIG